MFLIRKAERKDTPLVLEYIKKIACYEKMLDEVTATAEILEKSLFDQKSAAVLIGEVDGIPVGFALYYQNFSTFVGKPGLYLEDIFVDKEMRGKGFGKKLFQAVAAEADRMGCERMEWSCLDWNQPSIGFYLSMGAVPMKGWTVYRLAGDKIGRAANKT